MKTTLQWTTYKLPRDTHELPHKLPRDLPRNTHQLPHKLSNELPYGLCHKLSHECPTSYPTCLSSLMLYPRLTRHALNSFGSRRRVRFRSKWKKDLRNSSIWSLVMPFESRVKICHKNTQCTGCWTCKTQGAQNDVAHCVCYIEVYLRIDKAVN